MDYVPLVSCIVSFIFAVTVLDQYFARRKPFQLLWALGLFMYSLSTFTEFYWNVVGHVDVLFRLWYLVGAILVAAYLGQGTLYLLMKRKPANIFMIVLALFTVYSVVRVFMAPLDVASLTKLSGVGVMPADLRFVVTPLLNAFGTFALVGGAVYSAWIFWRKRILPHRVVANVFIAAGAMLPAIGGTHIATPSGDINLFFVMELIGVILMFIGFLRTKEVFGLYRFPLVHGFKKIET